MPFRSYIKERELQLAKKFKKQLEKKTQMLQAGLRIQQENMNMMKEQLRMLQDSKLQVRDQFHVSGRKGLSSRS